MSERIQAIRGMNDVLPDETPLWQYVEQIFIDCVRAYGYQEIRFPLLESTQLFKRTVGEVTDIVEKEMYTFPDLNGDSLSLRPEGTAGCLRACLEHGLLHNQQQKLWYLGPMFRHERPQKGRYRQFTHFGVEAFGFSEAGIDLELLLLCQRLWQQLGLLDFVRLEINSIGEWSERLAYKTLLVDYFKSQEDRLDEDSKRRLHKNPLRILDSKNPAMKQVIADAPKLIDHLGETSKARFKALCEGLDALHIAYTVNPVLVRGLDYYGQTVFEWVTDHLGSQATVCAGGRYDKLGEHLGGAPIPAIGFAIGIERIILLMEALNLKSLDAKKNALFVISIDESAKIKALSLAESIRDAFPGIEVTVNLLTLSYKSQFKKADKSGARLALILGEEELKNQQISIKDLRKDSQQITIDQSQIEVFLKNLGIQ